MSLRVRRALVAGVLTAVAVAVPPAVVAVAGSVFTVTKTFDTDDGSCDADCSLREAIAAAAAVPGFDRIIFTEAAEFTHNLTLGQLRISSAVRIDGAGQRITVRSGGGGARVFRIDANAAAELVGLTIADGRADAGGVGNHGAGILNLGRLLLTGVTVRGGIAAGAGGGIYSSGVLTLVNSVVVDNSAAEGGGIASDGTLSVHASVVRDNVGTFSGGGIGNGGDAWVTDSTISGNSTSVDGGGVSNMGSLTMVGSTVSGNDAFDYGGGILNGLFSGEAELLLVNSTVSGNSSVFFQGGGVASFGTAVIRKTTVTGNAANAFFDSGGGLWSNGSISLQNSIVAGNSADGSAANGAADCASGGISSLGFNVFGQLTGCAADGPGDRTAQPAQVPQALLAPLDTNGGLTRTHALVYAETNPAPDIGGTCATVDQRGFSAPVDGPDPDSGVKCDAGSVEAAAARTVEVRLSSQTEPISVPASGGEVTLSFGVSYFEPETITVDMWGEITYPDGSTLSPVFGPVELVLIQGGGGGFLHTQPISGPSGLYIYQLFVGDFASRTIIGADAVAITKGAQPR